MNIGDGERVRVSSPVGSIELDARLSPRRGLVVVVHGWGSRTSTLSGTYVRVDRVQT